MLNQDYDRRELLIRGGAVIGAGMFAVTGFARPANAAGAKVEKRRLLTTTASFDPVRPETARIIQQGLKGIGWQIELDTLEYNQNIQRVIMQHEFDMFLVRLTGAANRVDPNVFVWQVHHSSQFKKGGYNWAGYSNPAIDKLSVAQQTEMDVEKRRALVYEAQQKIYDDDARAVLVYPTMTNAYRSDRLKGLVPQMGEGIGSFWSDLNAEVIEGDGYVRTGATAALKSLNPIAVKDANEFKELRMIYDRLMQIGPDGSLRPWLAEKVDAVDPTTIDVTLRDGAKWHDGKPLTVEDVTFSFEYSKKWKAPFFLSSLERISGIEVTGARALRFRLSEPFAPLLSNLFAAMFILPKHVWQDIPDKVDVDDPLNYPNENPVGSGPFKFDFWDRGSVLKVSANTDHFSPPKSAGVIRIVYGSHDAMAAAIERNECDRTRYILKPTLMEDLNKVENVVGKGYPSHGFYDFSFNLTKPPFTDPVFRKAINLAVPRDLIRDLALSGHAENGGSVIGPANKFWHNPQVKAHGQNIKQARDLLASAGYGWDSDGQLRYPG
jgi:peptide/nickel transport system substrate-binding protein